MRLAASFSAAFKKNKSREIGDFSPVSRFFINPYYFSPVSPVRRPADGKRAGRECSERPDSFFKPVFPALR